MASSIQRIPPNPPAFSICPGPAFSSCLPRTRALWEGRGGRGRVATCQLRMLAVCGMLVAGRMRTGRIHFLVWPLASWVDLSMFFKPLSLGIGICKLGQQCLPPRVSRRMMSRRNVEEGSALERSASRWAGY